MDYSMQSSRQTIVIKPSRQMERLAERIHNPQDLHDGLLAVEYDEVKGRMSREMLEASTARMVGALIGK